MQWVDVAHLGDTAANYAIKFEVFVKEPWTTGTIRFWNDWSWDGSYVYVWEPWKTNAAGLKTSGWQTIVVPLTAVLKKNDSNAAPKTISEYLLGNQMKAFHFTYNLPAADVAKFNMAVDNFRIVKIK